MLTVSYCAEVLRSVEHRCLNLTHGGIVYLDVKMACKDDAWTLLLGGVQRYMQSEYEKQGEWSSEDKM